MRLAEGIIGVAGYGLAGLAAVSLLLGAFLTNNTLHFNGDSREAAGVVVGHNETVADGKPRYSTLVAFTTETGERIEFRGQLNSPSKLLQDGERVPVRYLLAEPSTARIDSFVHNWLGAAVALGLGVLAALAALLLVRSAKRELAR